MTATRRRNFLTFLGTLPVVSDWMKVFGSTHVKPVKSKEPGDEEWQAKFLAVETLRLINTAEKWHFLATNEHIPLEQLHKSESYKKLIEVAGKHRFKRVVPKLPTDGRVELPGYDIFAEPNADRSKYVARVSMSGPRYTFAFASDEIGVIYEGVPLGGQSPTAASEGIDALIADKHPMGQLPKPEVPGRGLLFAMISLPRILDFLRASLPQGDKNGCHCCACEYPCSCDPKCSCSTICPSGSDCGYCCYNCGCSPCGCTWCRTTSCVVFCPDMQGDCAGFCDVCTGDYFSCDCAF